eukprot:CAMPEP_0170562716 /NCGR_PEP_ID=MMETSP0211-20121228/62134_1 /TAXON_ID=311385 /ORGANISM="Pseudokeronopsis sp., Strain OXSARD2" /LENGTH=64 /DNA_ID=CAMNT_0010879985 /DNA_START=129 /DNA_END=323 /DNA_ORIENTATION=-
MKKPLQLYFPEYEVGSVRSNRLAEASLPHSKMVSMEDQIRKMVQKYNERQNERKLLQYCNSGNY